MHVLIRIQLPSPVRRRRWSQTSGGVTRKHGAARCAVAVSANQIIRKRDEPTLFEHVVRVPQPPDQSSNAGNPKGGKPGRHFFDDFLWSHKESHQHAGLLPASALGQLPAKLPAKIERLFSVLESSLFHTGSATC